MKSTAFVYIVRCADGTLYTGYARDPHARTAAHNRGRGAKYTAGRRPVRLVYVRPCRSPGAALSREHAIKQLTRAKKEALIAARRRGGASRRTPKTRRRLPHAKDETFTVEPTSRGKGQVASSVSKEPTTG